MNKVSEKVILTAISAVEAIIIVNFLEKVP